MSQHNVSPPDELKPGIGLVAAMSVVVGIVLGAGAFMKPPAVLGAAGDSNMALVAWMVGGLFSMAGGLTICELGTMFPRTGGVYVFLEEIFGEKAAFLYGWMIVFLFGPGTVGALTGYFSAVFCTLFNVPGQYACVVAAAVLAFVTIVNSISVQAAGKVQTLATVCKLFPIVLLVVFGLWQGNGQVLFMSSGQQAGVSFSLAVLATLFAYDGWAQVAALGGEIKNPSRILPLAIVGGLTFLVAVYLAINVALLKVIPADRLVALGHDASTVAAQTLFGLTGGNVIAVGIMISMIGALNGYAMTLSRVLYSMGLRGYMPGSSLWRHIDRDSNTPVNALLLLIFLAFFYHLLFDADKLSNLASFSIWVFYMLTFVAVFVARRTHAHVPRPYKVPLYPLVPAVAICGALYVFYGLLSSAPLDGLASILITLSGLPVFLYAKRRESGRPLAMPQIKTKYLVTACSLLLIAILTFAVRVVDLRPEIRVATEPGAAPFAYQQHGNLTGFDIELMDTLAAKAGLKAVYLPVALPSIFEALEKNHADVAIASLSVTPQRRQTVHFTYPYFSQGGLALLVKDNSPIQSAADLSGQKVGVPAGSTAAQYAAGLSTAKITAFFSSADMAAAFTRGELDAVIHDRPILDYMLRQGSLRGGRIATTLNSEEYAIAYSEKSKDAGEKLGKALEELKNSGELDLLLKKWNIRE